MCLTILLIKGDVQRKCYVSSRYDDVHLTILLCLNDKRTGVTFLISKEFLTMCITARTFVEKVMVTFELTTAKQEYLGTYLKNKALNLVDYTIRTCNLINTTHRTTYLEKNVLFQHK